MNRYIPQSQVPTNEIYLFVNPNANPPEFLIITVRGGQMQYASTTVLAQATTFTNPDDITKQQAAMQYNKPAVIQQGFRPTKLSMQEFLQRTGNVQPRPL